MKYKIYYLKLITFFIIICLAFGAGAIIGWIHSRKKLRTTINQYKDNQGKLFEFYQLLIRWKYLSQHHILISSWLVKKGIKTVAIYGMKELGELLYEELKQSGIEVNYGIDRDFNNIVSELTLLSPDDELKSVDAVIVTAIHYYDDIEKTLKNKGVDVPIYSLEDILFEMETDRYNAST